MNAFATKLEFENTSEITVKLVGQNFTTGEHYCGRRISLDFFKNALEYGHEIDVNSLEIDGYYFGSNAVSGYKEINQFLEKLNNNEYSVPLGVIQAILKETGLTDLENVFEYAESHVLDHILNADELGMSDLREVYGQQRSNETLDAISENLPKYQQEQITQYWDHQQFIDDLFINECKFISCGKVQVVISNR